MSEKLLENDLDAIDLRILGILQENARIPNIELAERVGLSPTPCLRRVRKLEETGVIRKYVTLLSPPALGLQASFFVNVTLERQVEGTLEHFEAEIQKHSEVMECYFMTGDADYLLRIITKDSQAFQQFLVEHLARIPGVSRIKSGLALKRVKYNTALPMTRRG